MMNLVQKKLLFSTLVTGLTFGCQKQVKDFVNGGASKLLVPTVSSATVSVTSPTLSAVTKSAVSITGTCTAGLTVNATGTDLTAPASTTCVGGNFSLPIVMTPADGVKNFVLSSTDGLGLTVTAAHSLIADNTAPILTQTSLASTVLTATNTVTYGGACETGLTVVIAGAQSSSVACAAGTWSFATNQTTDAAPHSYQFSQTDVAGNMTSVNADWTRDTTAPNLTLLTPALNSPSPAGATLTGTCESGLTIYATGAGISGSPSQLCVASAFSLAVSFSAGEGSKAITLNETDAAGNNSNLNWTLIKDSVAPVLTITGPAMNTVAVNGVTLTGACETGLTVSLSGTGLASPSSTTCSGSAYSQAIVFTATDGTKNIIVTQTDLAGNSSSANRDFIKDSTAPALTWTSPANGTSAQTQITAVGACETGLSLNFAGAGLLSPFSTTCTGGVYSQALFFSSGEGSKVLTITQTDAVGNSTTVTQTDFRDNTNPAITQTTFASPSSTTSDTVVFGGACETGLTVTAKIGAVTDGTAGCAAGTWSYTSASQTTDATRVYTFSQTDAAGNIGTISASWTRDKVAPILTFSSSSSFLTSSNTVTFAGTCETGFAVNITGAQTGSTACTAGAWSYATSKSVDGIYNYTFAQTDAAGNTGSIAGTWERNTVGPVITITSTTPLLSSGGSTTITGNCVNGLAITVSNAISDTATCSGGVFSYLASVATDGSRTYTFSQTDALMNTSSASAVWVRDTSPPVFTASQALIGTGSGTVGASYTKLSFAATDSLTRVTQFCYKVDDSVDPLAGDPCWVPLTSTPPNVTPALSISVLNFPFLLSFDPGSHDVYLWAKDELGNISAQSNTSGKDKATTNYTPATPPSVSAVIATSSNTPSNPPTPGNLSVSAGQPIYVKWTASGIFGAGPVALEFSTDDVTWTPITSALPNSQGSGCTADDAGSSLDDGMTGCYVFTSPTGGTIRLRVGATDTSGSVAYKSSTLLNTGNVKILAGNTDDGLGSSAKSAMLFNRIFDNYQVDKGSFVILDDGTFIFKDYLRGLLRVRPSDGLLTQFIPVTGTSSGDGDLSTATLKKPYQISLDYQGRILIWDYDQIRRIDLTTNSITRIIGGGGQTGDTVADALQVKIDPAAGLSNQWEGEQWRSPMSPFIPLPNGDIYFQSENWNWDYLGQRFRLYRPSGPNQVTAFYPSGVGSANNNPNNINQASLGSLALRFDPVTSTVQNFYLMAVNVWGRNGYRTPARVGDEYNPVTLDASTYSPVTADASGHTYISSPTDDFWFVRFNGRDGKLYAFSRAYGGVYKYNVGTNNWTQILGNGLGSCADGTAALSCGVKLTDVFITSTGKLYFMDGGRLRTLTSGGNVTTIYGQSFSSGNGGSPLQARFGQISEVQVANDGSLMIVDKTELFVRETNSARTVINHLTGNSRHAHPAFSVDVANQPIHFDWDRFGMYYDKSNKEIYYVIASGPSRYIARLNRSTNQWEKFIGGGATPVISGDGLLGNQVSISMPRVIGVGNGEVLLQDVRDWLGTGDYTTELLTDTGLYRFNQTTTVQNSLLKYQGTYNRFAAGINDGLQWCADGTPLSNCKGPVAWWGGGGSAVYDTHASRWIIGGNNWSTVIRSVDPALGTMQTLANLPRFAAGNVAHRYSSGVDYLYYCAPGGSVYKYNVNTMVETSIPLASSMTCMPEATIYYSNPIVYDATNDKIIVVVYHHGLYGVVQLDP